ncbi:hypothetical protein I79_007148 [Cricetulus griseus]|uniref:Uncharacterized protein n=1 Tax=Cricetulus griseus TaxID=10029 RepID=G3H9R8_CRIGR|nr:hypothetical protein I79_007148 [Cricetulus griseus]
MTCKFQLQGSTPRLLSEPRECKPVRDPRPNTTCSHLRHRCSWVDLSLQFPF